MSIRPNQLLTVLADCSGNQELVGIGNDALDTDFDALGLDSLAVLESVARIGREHGIHISDEEVHDLGTPLALLNRLNQAQSGGDEDTDAEERLPVVVVGAGLVGLALAGELAAHGIGVTVLERRSTPETMVRAGSVGPLAVALLRRRGLADELDRAERETVERYRAMADSAAGAVGHALPKEHLMRHREGRACQRLDAPDAGGAAGPRRHPAAARRRTRRRRGVGARGDRDRAGRPGSVGHCGRTRRRATPPRGLRGRLRRRRQHGAQAHAASR